MTDISQEKISAFKSFIEKHDYFYIAGHKEPDGDCVSSCIGISKILEHFNKKFVLLNAGPFKRIEIRKYAGLFTDTLDFQTNEERKSTGLILCDCSELARLGELDGDLEDFDTFIIDHHKTSETNSENSIIDPSSPAAALLVQILYENLIGNLPQELAEIIFFGTMTDTGFFRFLSASDANVLVAVSRLLNAGADPRKTYDYITSGKAYSTRKLLGILLDHAERYLDGKLIVTYETLEDTKKWGQEGRDSDALYSTLLQVQGVEAVAFVRQDSEITVTAGLRSRDKVDVSSVASKFGGGGHKNASGLSCNGKLETFIPTLVKEFAKIM